MAEQVAAMRLQGAPRELVHQARQLALEHLRNDTLDLLSSSGALMRCFAKLNDPQLSLHALVPDIASDPALTARVMRAAGSAAFATLEPANTLPQALGRLGARHLRFLIAELAAGQVYGQRDPRISQALKGLWEQSIAAAILSRELVQLKRISDPDAAYITGLLADLGKPIALWALLKLEGESRRLVDGWAEAESWASVVEETHRELGIALATQWRLPREIVDVMARGESFDEQHPASTANCVLLAKALAVRESGYGGLRSPERIAAEISTGKRLLQLTDEPLTRVCQGLQAQVRRQLG